MKLSKSIQVRYKGKKYIIKNYEICDNIFSKARGLMFRSRNYSKPLLFVFSKAEKHVIHSFFCHEFLGVWMVFDGKKIRVIDEKIVSPYKFSVIPKEKFNLLLEIPLSYFEFADEKAKV